MVTYVGLHAQLASIMEVLANAAVADICRLVDDALAAVRSEVSRTQRENVALKSKVRLMEVQGHRDGATCSGSEHFEEHPAAVNTSSKPASLGSSESQLSRITTAMCPMPAMMTEPPVEPDLSTIKKERLEEELRGCSVFKDHPVVSSSRARSSSCSFPAEDDRPLHVQASVSITEAQVRVSHRFEKDHFPKPDTQRQRKATEEVTNLTAPQAENAHSGLGLYCLPAEQTHETVTRSSVSHRAQEIKDVGDKGGETVCLVDPGDSLPLPQCSGATVIDAQTVNGGKTLELDVLSTHTAVNSVRGAAQAVAADWRGETAETASAVKVEDQIQPCWSENAAFGADNLVYISTDATEEVKVNNNRLMSNNCFLSQSYHRASDSGKKCTELDTDGFDSSSFDDLFSSPEVARSLIAPHKDCTEGGAKEQLLSSSRAASFPYLSSKRSFGNLSAPTSESVTFRNPSSDSRSKVLPSNIGRVFSCQQCNKMFSSSRDLAVHQRSHAGETIYHCHVCKKPFVHPNQLKTHQRVHTGEKPFSCTQCGKRFSQSSHIKRHMSVHTGEKRYSCSLCGKRFSQACSLKVHQAVHTGERPYSCTKCGKSFSVLGNLVRHQSVHIGR
ncbi:zinc finger Y-chromosomal protein 2-like isoform X2 [Thalassophryne amazonica]|uniref:zinc finger Y-chromosomal protein 2-like isoform X2 n=1 Tax=Thalassophryne amazonica TaxID=390379 RepID=UPI001470D61E|nr:zinc finger Y-chromosomal protein 2-like isoform X2 [Thalassophryne amazonica]